MMADRDTLPHGTPVGYAQGCRTAAVCVNHGSVELMTCVEADTRAKWDLAYSRRVQAGELSALREAFEGEGYAKWRPTTRPVWVEESFEVEPVRPTPTFERVRTDPEARRVAAQRRLEEVAGVPLQIIEDAPKPAAAGAPEASWGSAELGPYLAALDQVAAEFAAEISGGTGGVAPLVDGVRTSEVLLGAPSGEGHVASVPPESGRRKPGRPSTPFPHGTKAGYVRGCHKKDEGRCPSKLAGGLSCAEAEREYHRGLRPAKVPPASSADSFESVRRELAVAREQLAVAVTAMTAIRVRLDALVSELFREAS